MAKRRQQRSPLRTESRNHRQQRERTKSAQYRRNVITAFAVLSLLTIALTISEYRATGHLHVYVGLLACDVMLAIIAMLLGFPFE